MTPENAPRDVVEIVDWSSGVVTKTLRAARSAERRIDVVLSWKLAKDVRKELTEIRDLLREGRR